jgi:hypothetical protein
MITTAVGYSAIGYIALSAFGVGLIAGVFLAAGIFALGGKAKQALKK